MIDLLGTIRPSPLEDSSGNPIHAPIFLALFMLFCALFISCDLLNAPTKPDYFRSINEEIAYANAPWVPLQIENGGLGTSVPGQGTQAQVVKLGYSFTHRFQPARDYPVVSGWEAWYSGEEPFAVWKPGEPAVGAELVKFVPVNEAATELEIFVYVMPPSGNLFIGPLGAHLNEQAIRVLADPRWGTVFSESMFQRKRGFSFTVEFAASDAWDFMGWKAYPFNNQSADNLTPDTLGQELPASAVTIEVTGPGRATVTVNTEESVLLVPLCVTPVRVDYTNPPQGSPTVYNTAQPVTILFSTELNPSTVKFGEGFIQITGQSGAAPVDISTHYRAPVYNEAAKTVAITPNPDNLFGSDAVVTVTLGTGITAKYGNRLAAPTSFSFSISTAGLVVMNMYAASEVWAVHDPVQYGSGFFSQWANYERDRRLRINASAVPLPRYEVTLYFGVQALGDVDNDIAHAIDIAEIHYAHLNGDEVSGSLGQPVTAGKGGTYVISEMETTGAGQAYRSANPNAGKYYKAVYSWAAAPTPGILRLAVLPSSAQVPAEDWRTLITESRGYITVVYDNLAPGGTETAVFSNSVTVSIDGAGAVYNYNSSQSIMAAALNFRNIRDNYYNGGPYGILNSSGGKPRTMDPQYDLEWQWRIVTGASVNYEDTTWRGLVDINNDPAGEITNYNLSSLGSENMAREVQVRYRDSLSWTSEWQTVGRVRYFNAPPVTDVSTWTAVYNEGTNNITLTWTLPAEMSGVEVSVNGGMPVKYARWVPGSGAETLHTHPIANVPRISELGIRSGQQTSNIFEYTVSLSAYNEFDKQENPTVFKIWNIPGMSVSSTYPAIEVTSQDGIYDSVNRTIGLANLALNDQDVTYVITNDITITVGTWAPIGSGTGATTAFRGKFYGNGHTITINAGTYTDYSGIFANVNNGEIRDLRVQYAGNVTTDITVTTADVYIGGLVGNATDGTKIRNIIVSSGTSTTLTANADYTNTTTNLYNTFMGGIAGYVTGNDSAIENCYSDLNVKLTGTGNNTLNMGGIVGRFGLISGSLTSINLRSITAKGNVQATGPYIVIAGGLAGTTRTGGTIKDVVVSGTVSLKDSAYSDYLYGSNNLAVCGGIIGHLYDATLEDIYFDGLLDFSNDSTPSGLPPLGRSFIGGLVGNTGGSNSISGYITGQNNKEISIERCFVRGGITVIDYTKGEHRFGGVSGCTVGNNNTTRIVRFKDCAYLEGDITVTKWQGTVSHIGGFAGNVVANTSFVNCRVLASSMKVNTAGGDIGGFTGLIRGNMNGCYTNFPMEIEFVDKLDAGEYDCSAGGLIGRFESNDPSQNWVVSECYAGGSVTVSGNGRYVHAGGLIGRLGGEQNPSSDPPKFNANVTLRNSYATGNVFVSSTNNRAGLGGLNPYPWPFVYAGGLVGSMQIKDNIFDWINPQAVEYCFASGSVTAQSSYYTNTTDCATVYAGGLVGNRINGPINNCAVLGSYVMVKHGTSTPAQTSLGRVIGNLSGPITNVEPSGGGSVSSNYALSTMILRTVPYTSDTITERSPSNSSTGAGKDGLTTTLTNFMSSVYWQNTGTYDLNFSNTVWDFSTPALGRGYPLLRNLGGQ